jgi:hypothetical protein
MLLNDTATDLYLKMSADGLKKASFKIEYSKFAVGENAGVTLVYEHRSLVEKHFLPLIKR